MLKFYTVSDPLLHEPEAENTPNNKQNREKQKPPGGGRVPTFFNTIVAIVQPQGTGALKQEQKITIIYDISNCTIQYVIATLLHGKEGSEQEQKTTNIYIQL